MSQDSKNWYAWLNKMPPRPDDFHVIGDVLVGNPGVEANLVMMEPQGINPNILMLQLTLVQRPGMWPQVMTWAHARFDKALAPSGPEYTEVHVFKDGTRIETLPVDIVH